MSVSKAQLTSFAETRSEKAGCFGEVKMTDEELSRECQKLIVTSFIAGRQHSLLLWISHNDFFFFACLRLIFRLQKGVSLTSHST